MNSAIYRGRVRHRRFAPRPHEFAYDLFMVCLDLAELKSVFRGRWFWSVERANVASFRRADHLGDPKEPLVESVRKLVTAATGVPPSGPIRLLTHLRYFGHCFNPVSFYYCFDPDGVKVECIVAEVNNTPWGERHCYVLPADPAADRCGRWRFDKEFHVSPFMPMDMQYDWRFAAPGEALAVHMRCEREGVCVFDASLALRRQPVTGRALAAALWRFPLMTLQVVAAIHWQALRLWFKRVPVFSHPGKLTRTRAAQPLR